MATVGAVLSKIQSKAAAYLLHASSPPYHAGFQGFCVVSLQRRGSRAGSPGLHWPFPPLLRG